MADYTNFCCRASGSNLNAGSVDGSTTEPATTPLVTYPGGSWTSATDIFVAAVGADMTQAVVGRFASLCHDGDVAPVSNQFLVARITAVNAGTRSITLSTTARALFGTEVATGTRTLRIGGAWLGPSGASGFPFNLGILNLTNAATNPARVNLKADQTYAMTANINVPSATNGTMFHGYASAYGDGGKATIDGGAAGAAYNLLTTSGPLGGGLWLDSLVFNRNGTGTATAGVSLAANTFIVLFSRCAFSGMTGAGLSTAGTNASVACVECEFFGNNTANSATAGAITAASHGNAYHRCTVHDNTGTNAIGVRHTAGHLTMTDCVIESNGSHGLDLNSAGNAYVARCDFYSNGGSGINRSNANRAWIESCNLVKNAGYGISGGANMAALLWNCGFGTGTQANALGTVQGTAHDEAGRVTYGTDLTPWTDPATGDFRIALDPARGAGRGAFTQTAAGYSGTIAYPDIGAGQSRAGGGHLADHAESALLNGTAQPADLYAQLHIGDPGEAATANVAATTARVLVPRATASGGAQANSSAITWAGLAASETLTHLSLWDAGSGGNPWWRGPLDSAVSVTAGNAFTIAAGDLTLVLD